MLDPATTQTVTSTTTIIISVLSSSILTVVVTKLLEYYFSTVNYKRDYYKLLLNKRLQSYESLLNMLFRFNRATIDIDGKPFLSEFATYPQIISTYESFHALDNNMMWLTKQSADHLNTLYAGMIKFMNLHKISQISRPNEIILFAKDFYPFFINLSNSLHLAIVQDLKTLHQIENFLAQEENNLKKPIKPTAI